VTGHATPLEREIIDTLEHQLSVDASPIADLVQLARLYICPDHREDEAIELLEAALNRDSANAEAKFWLAYCLVMFKMDTDSVSRALSLFTELANSDSDEVFAAAAWDFLPSVYMELGNTSPAEKIKCYSRSVELQPQWVHNRLHLAQALLEIGENERALAEAEMALQNRVEAGETYCRAVDNSFEEEITGRAAPLGTVEEKVAKIAKNAQPKRRFWGRRRQRPITRL
jgi:tetratricopeptide (TPR) repeat protein